MNFPSSLQVHPKGYLNCAIKSSNNLAEVISYLMELSVSSLKYAAFLLLLQQICSSHLVNSSSIHSDKLALLQFKLQLSNNTLGPLSSWNDSLPLCRWAGVTCGGHQHPDRVTGLELESLELEGPIPKSLANLTFLKRLHLPNNSFQGFIPKELGQLFRLEYVNLSSNSLNGGIPQSLLNCSHLQMISLRSNMLQGEIPPNFPPLTTLDLSNNMFTGVIPPSLGNLTRLTYLDLSDNSLTGSIPSSAGMLSMVTFFDLSRNNLTGDLPPAIWNLTHVTKFEVHDNNLSGALPMDLGDRFPHLQKLLLFDNNFTGPIPLSISNASELENIQLFYNGFSGTIPHNLGLLQNLYSLILGNNLLEATNVQDWRFFTGLVNCSNLQVLDVSNNMLGGILPDAIVNLTTGLTWLGMMGNHISGTIPKEIANLVNLRLLRMRQNYLTGSIPPSIGRLQMLNVLYLSQNMFHGEIPMEIGNLTQLSRLYLEENQLTGRVPESIAKCKTLQLLNLGYNNLTGTIPAKIMSMSSLSIYLSFSSNSLTGLLPSEIGSLTSLDALDISNNNLSGEVPSTLGKCISIEYIFMEGNFFGGSIPSTLRQLKGLQVLDFSRNNFSGQIPEFLAGFIYLHNLNLSFNKFEGEVPKDGIFANLSAISIYGNNNLCGGSPALDLPACPIQSPAKKHDSAKLTKIIAVVSTVSCFMLLCCSLIAWHYIKKSRRPLKVLSQKTQHLRITYSDLAKATDGFSAANLIGAGSFGSVYRAVMEFDEAKIVAVKVIDQKQKGATKSFMAECEALRNIRHRNLIKIFTTCSSADFRGNAFNALIFEFMPNGSLERWLHPLHHEELGSPNLSLVQRLDIAIDVANALDYLHHRIAVPVVHCDLKPSNVLLDDDLVAHVGDFGLARFLDRSANGTPTKSTSTSGLKGTVGYVAPEYGMANKVSTQGDVYSYGILLLEMFTGRRPTDQDFMEGLSLRNFVATAFPGQLIKIVDERMFLDIDAEGNNDRNKRDEIHECLASVFRIGLDCTQELPSERMYMGDVAKELMATKAEFLQECCSAEVKCPSSM